MSRLGLDEVMGKIHKLPSLPAVVLELIASLGQEDVSIDIGEEDRL